MDEVRTDAINGAVRRKRSRNSRRPRPESQSLTESHDRLLVSPSPPSDDMYKASSDDDVGHDANHKQKESSLDHCISRIPSASNKKEDRGFHASGRVGSNSKRSSEGVLAPTNWKSNGKTKDGSTQKAKNGESHSSVLGLAMDDYVNEAKVKKVKLKVGGVIRTIHANSTGTDVAANGSSTKNNVIQGNADDVHSPDKMSGLQGIPWKDFSSGGLPKVNSVKGKGSQKNVSAKQEGQVGPMRKSKRVPKRRVLDVEFSGDDEDDEIRYLEKLKSSKIFSLFEEDVQEPAKKQRKLTKVSGVGNAGTLKSSKDGKGKPGSDQLSEDMDYEDEDEQLSESELGGKKKKQKKESIEALLETKRETTLTTRQRALQSSKDASSSHLIEFPNGLPPAPPPRKQKEKLTDVEQQLKKAEAAQRRRLQNEKAANEAQAEAIRKILGQDSNRKKQEEKNKKRQEELAQEKAANALVIASNTVRWLIRPSGNIVTFSEDPGLPGLFDSKGCSYPPPRERCAGPLCGNPYKYRDSKTKLPLCSLQCYKAVQEQGAETIC